MKSDNSIRLELESSFLQINQLASGGRFDDAIKLCEELYTEYPEVPRVVHALGVISYRAGLQERGETLVRQSLHIDPEYTDALNSLGNICKETGRYEEATEAYRKIITHSPDNFLAHANLSASLKECGSIQEALIHALQAVRFNPSYDAGHMSLGNIYLSLGDVERAFDSYCTASSLNPSNFAAHANVLHVMNYLPDSSQRTIYRESVRWGRLHTSAQSRLWKPHLNIPDPDRRLRVGYVSGDFKLHPVSHHLKPVLMHHDPARFEIFLYDSFGKTDFMTDSLIAVSDAYRDISKLPHDKAEEIIRLDGIDILVDLSGHTGHNRLMLFARKPAPVQVSWLGYFNTTGMKAIDYLISDPVTIPLGQDQLFSEEVIRLPDGRFCYEAPVYAPEVAGSPVLNTGCITFGSFNKIAKINRQVVRVWSEAIKAVPGSRLLLKWSALSIDQARETLLQSFADHGVSPDRIMIRNESPHPDMLAEYGDVDIALDTFPFNGGATTCEALWMGVPVVTLRGGLPISRQSASFLKTVGLPELIADTADEFVEIVRNLAADHVRLEAMRQDLREKMASSALCDGKRFAGHLESAYRSIWESWCARQQLGLNRKRGLGRISADEFYNAGVSNMDTADYLSAERWFRHAIRQRPAFALAWNNLGITLSVTGRALLARRAFRTAVRYDPQLADACSNLGREFSDSGNPETAIRWFRKAVALNPASSRFLLNLGVAADRLKRASEARVALERAVEIDPNDPLALKVLAGLVLQWGDVDKAVQLLQKALEIAPETIDLVSTYLFTLNYSSATRQEYIHAESTKWGDVFASSAFPLLSNQVTEGEKIRVGFVSSDLRLHPGGILFLPLAEHYDRSRYSFTCYSNSDKQDAMTERIRALVDDWRCIHGAGDDEVACQIRADRIDVLFDLTGHTQGQRFSLFAMKPAPVQASWLGYFNTNGVAGMDYIIGDDDFARPNEEQWFSEKVLRLGSSRFCYTPPNVCPDVEASPCLENGYITFGCFNNSAKLSTEVIAVWARLLHAVPDARMVLKWSTFNDKVFRDYFRKKFEAYGISRKRIELRGQSSHFMMLAEYGDIDIALDPFPFTGGMTSLEALWMGVPVVTMPGELPVSRQTKNFLRSLRLDELVAADADEYVRIAAALASDSQRLSALRSRLRPTMAASSLCDGKDFADRMGKAIEFMVTEKRGHP